MAVKLFHSTVNPQHICLGCNLLNWKKEKNKNIQLPIRVKNTEMQSTSCIDFSHQF